MIRWGIAIISLAVAAAAATTDAATPSISASVDSASGVFHVTVNGAEWFSGGDTSVTFDGVKYSASAGTLALNGSVAVQGSDAVGSYTGTTLLWRAAGAGGAAARFETRVRVYADSAAVVFEQAFPDGAKNLSVGDIDAVSSSFPAFDLRSDAKVAAAAPQRGYQQWASFGTPGSDPNAAGPWPPVGSSALAASWKRETGSLAVFAVDLSATVVISPMTSFDAWGQEYDDPGRAFTWGVRGSAVSVPPGFTMATVAVASGGGINRAMYAWGDVLLRVGGKERGAYREDVSLNYLGYTTANGAFYYYNTEPGKNYEQTILDLKAYSEEIGLPIRWILYDSWFYSKSGGTGPDPSNGVTNWTDADPKIFPSGLKFMYDQTKWPVVAHNRAWSSINVYLKSYTWELGKDLAGDVIALPVEQQFWSDLFDAATRWGCLQYQQDWMYTQQGMQQLQANTTLANLWQNQMNTELASRDMRFGFGGVRMSNWLMSTTFPTATNGRATDDYEAGRRPQWQIGVSSVFTWAIDVMPVKDGFWTTANQPGNAYGDNRTEPYSRLHAAAATLTRAAVTPSDKIGLADRALIMRSCMDDGRLLQPDAPARALDAMLLRMALNASDGPAGQVWGTTTTVAGAGTYVHVLVADVAQPFSLSVADVVSAGADGHASLAQSFLVVENSNASAAAPTTVSFSSSRPLSVPACGRTDFRLFHAAPTLANGWTLLGEVAKWLPVSAARVRIVRASSDSGGAVHATIVGAAGEKVTLWFADPSGTVSSTTCVVGDDLVAVVSSSGECSPA